MPRTVGSVSLLSVPGSDFIMRRSYMVSFASKRRQASNSPAGAEGSPISMVTAHGIAAASAPLSAVPVVLGPPFGAGVRTGRFHVALAMHDPAGTLRLLRPLRGQARGNDRVPGGTFRAGLDAIEGCEEMGLRAAWSASAIAAERGCAANSRAMASERDSGALVAADRLCCDRAASTWRSPSGQA